MQDELILVDDDDREIGVMEKQRAHEEGRLHRAISIFIFHPDGQMLLQRRAMHKYHSAGLWSNACCSHPRPGENVLRAAHRRLREEMGFDCELTRSHAFTYRVEFPDGLIEHEYDHVFVGTADVTPFPDRREVGEWKWITIDDLHADLEAHPERYTYWFRIACKDLMIYLSPEGKE